MSTILLTVCSLSANKEYKQLRTYIKKGGNASQMVTLIEQCEKNENIQNDPELYFLAAGVQRKINDGENEKLYLKQNYDTVSFFSSIYGVFNYLIKCDEKEVLANKKDKIKIKYRSKSHTILKDYYPNLYNAGLFFIKKKNYKNAEQYFSMYIDAAQTPIFVNDHLWQKDTKIPRAAFWSMTSCFALKEYTNVFKYEKLAIRDTANIDLYLQYRALSYAELKDTANFVKELRCGLDKVPTDLFFFSNLTDYYNNTKQYQTALTLTDSLLKIYPQKTLFKFAKSVVLYNLKDYDNCISLSKEIIDADTTNADAYFYLGSCYFNKAVIIDDKISPDITARDFNKNKNEAKILFSMSLPYIEHYRILRKEDKERWAPLLYRIYLSLNKEKQFNEIDEILKQNRKQ